MKRTALWLAAGAALAAVSAAAAHPVSVDDDAMNRRFEQMDRMMEGMPQMRGEARHEAIHEHMHLMMQQMGAMHGMQTGHGGPMMMGQAPARGMQGGADMGHRLDAMERRMDAMQRMMEHMLHQQDMMGEEDDR